MLILLMIQQIIASTTHVVTKSLITNISPPTLLLMRAFIASLFFLSLIPLKRLALKKIDKKDIPLFIILGLINIPLNQFLFFTSLKYTSAPNIALAYALTPTFVLVISIFFLKEKVTFFKTLGIIVAFGGTTMILFEKGFDFSSDNFLGINLGLLASLSWAFYTLIGKKFVVKYGASFTNMISMILGFFFFLPVFFAVKAPFNYIDFTLNQWLLVIYLGVVTSGIAYILWYNALKSIDASKVAVFNNIQPVLTTILAIIFLGQSLTFLFVIGAAITLVGVFITQKG